MMVLYSKQLLTKTLKYVEISAFNSLFNRPTVNTL